MVLNGGELNGTRILSADAVREMSSVQTEGVKAGFAVGHAWGLGFAIVIDPQGATAALSTGSFGHGGAFGTQGWIDPTQQMIYVLLVARQNFGGGDESDIRRDFQNLGAAAFRN